LVKTLSISQAAMFSRTGMPTSSRVQIETLIVRSKQERPSGIEKDLTHRGPRGGGKIDSWCKAKLEAKPETDGRSSVQKAEPRRPARRSADAWFCWA
jgi:hypothetical protein